MSASKVYFSDMRCPVGTGLLDKLKKLIEKAGIDLEVTEAQGGPAVVAALPAFQVCVMLTKLQLNDFEPAVNLATLTKLQDAHLKYIPYENFDCLNGKITSLKRQDMFNKVIMHNRGGICFELNGLYNWLLESLGFDVTSYSARFIDKMETYQLRRHRVGALRRHPCGEPVHDLAPGPEAVFRVGLVFGQARHRPLEGMGVQVRHTRHDDPFDARRLRIRR